MPLLINSTLRYTSGAILFHWLMALLIGLVAISGLLFESVPKVWDATLLNLHAVLGSSILVLLVARIAWRMTHRPPPLPAGTGRIQRSLTHSGHVALYILMAAVPLLGLVALLARGKGIDFGFFQLLSPMVRTPAISKPSRELHALLAYGLMALAGGHIVMALWHQFMVGDGSLARILPAAKAASPH